MTWSAVADVAAAVCFLLAAFLTLVAGIGLLRFPDLLARLHAGSKPQVLGLLLAMVGLAIRVRERGVLGVLILVVLFQAITVPVAAHMTGRAGYRTGQIRSDLLVRDELTEDLEAMRHLEEGGGSAGPGSGPAEPEARGRPKV